MYIYIKRERKREKEIVIERHVLHEIYESFYAVCRFSEKGRKRERKRECMYVRVCAALEKGSEREEEKESEMVG